MTGASVLQKLCAAIGRFAGARKGNVAVIFALSAIPIISFVGAAIDYTRANAARSSMQAALDSTSLMLSKDLSDGTINSTQIESKATAYFNALYNNKDAYNVSVTPVYVPPSGSTPANIKLDGSGTIVTEFMRVAGFPTMNFNASSTSTWGNVRMRVAMVLDVTGSMADDGKMTAMKPAAKALVDQLSALAATNGDIYISLVPFSKDVNTELQGRIVDRLDRLGRQQRLQHLPRLECQGQMHQFLLDPQQSRHLDRLLHRPHPELRHDKHDASTTANTATLFPAEQYSYCDNSGAKIATIMPLSYDWTALKAKIDTFVPTGNTNQGIGLAWGWMTLTQSDPFNAPAKDPNFVYKDAIVILSDGLNTQNRWYTSASSIDARQMILCGNAKAAGITIYTVQVNTGGDPTSAVLQYCAANASSFYLGTSASQTASVFSQIGTQLSKLRISK